MNLGHQMQRRESGLYAPLPPSLLDPGAFDAKAFDPLLLASAAGAAAQQGARRQTLGGWAVADYDSITHHFRGDLGVTDAGAGEVSAWTDQISGDAISQAAGSLRPNTATRDGQAAIEFDGSDRLQGAFGGGAIGGPTTIVMVAEQRTLGGSNQYWFDSNAATNRLLCQENGTSFFVKSDGAAQNTSVSSATAMMLIAAVFDGSNSAFYKNDLGTAAWTGNPGSAATMGGLTLGSSYTGTHTFDGWIWELLLAASADAASLAAFETYAKARYSGLPA